MTTSNQLATFKELVEDIRECMLVTSDESIGLRSRPMACSKVEDEKLWFFTSTTSEKVQEVYQDREVNCAFAKPSNKSYVSVSGRATVVHDLEKKKELYSPLLNAWFEGPEDPQATLLCVRVSHAEYWKDNSSTLITFAKIAAAALTNSDYAGGENEKISLS